MARAGDTVTLTYRADIRDLTKKLGSIEGITAAEARKTVKALSKELKKATPAIAAAAKSTGGATKATQALAAQLPDVFSQLQTGTPLFTIFSQQGLQVAQQLGLAQKAAGGMAGSLGAMLPVLGPVAAAVAVFGAGLLYANVQLDRAIEKQQAAAQTTAMTVDVYERLNAVLGEQTSDTDKQTKAFADLINEQQAHRTSLMAELQDQESWIDNSSGILVGLKGMQAGYDWVTDAEGTTNRLNGELEQNGVLIRAIESAARDAKEESEGLAAELALIASGGAEKAGRVEVKKSTLRAAAKKREAEAQRALNEALAAEKGALLAVMPDRAQLLASYDDQVAAQEAIIAKYGESSVQAQASASAILAIEEAKANSLIEFDKKVADAAIKQDERVAREAKALEDKREREQKQADAKELSEFEADQQAKFAIAAIATDALVDLSGILLDAKIANIDTETKAGREQAMKFAKAQKAIAVSGAIANTALGLVKSVATLGPPVPPNWEGMAGFASAAAIGTTAIAGAAATPLPEFPTGGVVPETSMDHRAVGIQGGEAVLNRAAVDRLGAEGVNEINRGGGGTQVVAVNMYEHRVFDAFIADNLRRNGPLRRAIRDAGKSNGPRVRT